MHEKSKNNMNKLKMHDGKLMITNGMSVKEFSKKFNLKI